MSIGEVASAVARVVAIVLAAGMAATDVGAQTPAQPTEPRVSLYGMVPGDPAGVGSEAAIQQVRPAAVDAEHKAKGGEFVFAPMPMVNPTLENGVSVVAGYLYRLDGDDRTTPPSATGIGGFKTSNDSWAAAVLQSLHLGHDRFD